MAGTATVLRTAKEIKKQNKMILKMLKYLLENNSLLTEADKEIKDTLLQEVGEFLPDYDE